MDRNAPMAIFTACLVSIIGVFALMIMPMVIQTYANVLEFTVDQGNNILIAEIAGGALASIFAMFWIRRVNWRIALGVAIAVVIGGNLLTVTLNDPGTITLVRFVVGFLGQGTAFAIGISIVGSTSDPDRNFGFVISSQVAFGVLALSTLPRLTELFASIGGIYIPLAALAGITLLLFKFVPEGPAAFEAAATETQSGSQALSVTTLIAMFIWCCGLGAMWGFIGVIAEAGGIAMVQAGTALAISSAVAITGSLGAATLAAKGAGRFLPITVALLVQMAMAWLLQGQMNFVEMVIKASIFQIFWNMTGPFFMGAIAASDTSGKISVLIPAAQTSGFFIGPAVVGLFLESSGLAAVNYVTITFCLLSLIIFVPLSTKLKAAGY